MTPLVVYKASAGSGKTYRLALEYTKILARDPEAYDGILAVTFTNKAAGEMKQRILSHLYGIAAGLDESRQFFASVCNDTGIEAERVRRNCSMALQNILHNYGHFRVGTIDSFFQQVLRNLARELNLSANLRVELSDGDLEKAAVDKMVTDLRPGQDTLRWILEQMEQNMDDDKAWNVIPTLERFSRHLSDDGFKDHRVRLQQLFAEEGFFDRYSSTMYAIIKDFESGIARRIDEMERVAKECGVEFKEFSNGADFVSYFKKLRGGDCGDDVCGKRLCERYENQLSWVKKGKKSDPFGALAEAASFLHPIFVELENFRRERSMGYLSAKATLRDLGNLRLLCAIDSHIHRQNADEGRFMLSDTQHFLHAFIGRSDAPFVYEKIGTRIRHIMIDEFQDTSTVQWNNFRVLIDDCLSTRGNSALIVGDVKQSIYRWRSGDWELLNDIEKQFRSDMVATISLQQNYRSMANIVRFNNAFFAAAIDNEAAMFAAESPDVGRDVQYRKAYADVCQGIPDNNKAGGEVRVDIIDAEQETMAARLLSTIGYLVDQCGASQSSIAVLVRGNNDISALAMSCREARPDLNFVSAEAFRLSQSGAVQLIMAALRYLVHPDDQLARATVVRLWFKLRGKEAATQLLMAGSESADALPDDFDASLSTLPLFQLVESLCHIFGVDRLDGEQIYIASLLDRVADFVADNSSDIEGLLEEWERDGGLAQKSIPASATDGIQFLTIHKSKGLEFDNVIVPYCDWPTAVSTGKSDIKWLIPREKPFNEIPVLPIKMAKQLKGTIFEGDYDKETFQTAIDNMNLLYVAFTRAARNLYVIARGDMCKSDRRARLLADILQEVGSRLEGAQVEETASDNKKMSVMSLRYGTFCPSDGQRRQSENPFMQRGSQLNVRLVTSPRRPVFAQSNKSRELFGRPYSAAAKGIALHSIFERVRTRSDFERELARAEQEGLLDGLRVSRQSVVSMVQPQFNDPLIASWFAPGLTLFNEQDIVAGGTAVYRPDRVMAKNGSITVVDYKFGEREEEEHKAQVAGYMSLLRSMGYAQVEGYLWYVALGKTVKITA